MADFNYISGIRLLIIHFCVLLYTKIQTIDVKPSIINDHRNLAYSPFPKNQHF